MNSKEADTNVNSVRVFLAIKDYIIENDFTRESYAPNKPTRDTRLIYMKHIISQDMPTESFTATSFDEINRLY